VLRHPPLKSLLPQVHASDFRQGPV